MTDSLAVGDAAGVYATIDRVVEAGHDPRRFAADLLDRFRDLIVLDAVPDAVEKGLIDYAGDQAMRMADQSRRIGVASLVRFADITHTTLTDMRGTTSPRLMLELLSARMLLPDASSDSAALLQRLERLERRQGLAARRSSRRPRPAERPAGRPRRRPGAEQPAARTEPAARLSSRPRDSAADGRTSRQGRASRPRPHAAPRPSSRDQADLRPKAEPRGRTPPASRPPRPSRRPSGRPPQPSQTGPISGHRRHRAPRRAVPPAEAPPDRPSPPSRARSAAACRAPRPRPTPTPCGSCGRR